MTRYGDSGIRMPVVVAGDDKGPQHLESVPLANGTGKAIADGVVPALSVWGITADNPLSIPLVQVFDTTSSNTGMNYQNERSGEANEM